MTKIKDEKKEVFYYKAALESFRAPISEQIVAIESFLKTASKKMTTEEKELIELIAKSSCYTQKMIGMISEIYALDNKIFKLDYKDFNFLDLINEIVSNSEIILKYEKLNVQFKTKENFLIHADKDRLMTAVETIFLNLFNYSYENTTIFIEIKKIKGRLSFEIQNKGREIKKEELKTMFDKYKLKSCCYCATGFNIGMYLTKKIIAAHFGQLILSSKNNVNTFGFTIPIN